MLPYETGAGHTPPYSEMTLAYLIAFFAALLSVIDVGAGKFRDREIVSVNRKMTAYGLYHTKVLKETLVQGERDLLSDLIKAGAVVPTDTLIIHNRLAQFDRDLESIRNQQEEIILGSEGIDQQRWSMPDIDNRLGRVKGILDWEADVEQLDLAGDNFDLASLLIELALVLGAIGFLTRTPRGRRLFQTLLILFGTGGAAFGVYGYYLALTM